MLRQRYAARVRRITVEGTRYVQSVRPNPDPEKAGSLLVLASFGKDSMESLMRARLYADSYNSLLQMSTSFHAELHNAGLRERARETVFAVYGWVLDRKAIESAIGGATVG